MYRFSSFVVGKKFLFLFRNKILNIQKTKTKADEALNCLLDRVKW